MFGKYVRELKKLIQIIAYLVGVLFCICMLWQRFLHQPPEWWMVAWVMVMLILALIYRIGNDS